MEEKMLKTTVLILALAFSSISQAHENTALAEAMKEMGQQFRIIAGSFRSGEVTVQQLNASETLQMAIAESSQHLPVTARTDAQKLAYMRSMAALAKEALVLEEQIEDILASDSQDLTEMKNTVRRMNEMRSEGHDAFRESDH